MHINAAIILAALSAVYKCAQSKTLTSLDGLNTKEVVIMPKVCTLERISQMSGYVCVHMELREVPQHLKADIELFDLSFNRIRELDKNSFARYADLQYLYLHENMIRTIGKDTFSHLTSLEAIDLSSNSMTTIPLELFQLPRLRNLRYNYNDLLDLNDDLKKLAKPIVAPLQLIDISKSKLPSVPDFGILPELLVLNISWNPLTELHPQQFSPFCRLKSVDLYNTTADPCMCRAVTAYLLHRSIDITDRPDCSSEFEHNIYCTENANGTLDTPLYDICLSEVQNRKKAEETRQTWRTIVLALVAFFAIFIGILYYFHRRNVQQIKQNEMKMTKLRQILQTENGNVEVLLHGKP